MSSEPTCVLVIDDEAPIRLLCRVNLEAEGMSVLEAADGPSGLEKARAEAPDVVLLDVMMPGLDGWRVAEELLDDPRTASIPIVFLTARAELRDRARGIDLGGIDYVTKPFNPVELAPLVRNLLGRVARGERDDAAAREADRVACAARARRDEVGGSAGEVGGDDVRAVVPEERADEIADADSREAGAKKVRAMLGACEPGAHDPARGAERAVPPREVLAGQ